MKLFKQQCERYLNNLGRIVSEGMKKERDPVYMWGENAGSLSVFWGKK